MTTFRTHNDRLRALALERRAGLTAAWVAEASLRVLASLRTLPAYRDAGTLAVYLAMPDEVQTAGIVAELGQRGAALLAPAWDRPERRYRFCGFDPGCGTAVGPFGVPEPDPKRWTELPADACVLVPGLVFTRDGDRLGHGKGHYDRLLKGHPGPRIGLAFDFQLADRVDRAPWDVPMDAVAAESGVFHRPAALKGTQP